MIWTMLASVNLVCALLAYSLLAYALAHLRWHGRGIFFVLLLIVICGQVWLIPEAISRFGFGWNITLYPLWSANWLVSAFSIVLLYQSLRSVSRDLEDAARLDGCGPFGIYWHVVLPLVRRSLFLIAILLVMATGVLIASLLLPSAELFRSMQPIEANIQLLIGDSLVMTLPLIGIFFLVHRYFRDGL